MGSSSSKDIERKKEVIISQEGFYSLDQSITQTSKSFRNSFYNTFNSRNIIIC